MHEEESFFAGDYRYRHIRYVQRYATGACLRIVRSVQDIYDVLKWPVILGLLYLNSMTLLIVMVLAYYTIPLPLSLGVWPYWLLMESPIIYYVWRRIQHEDSMARVMSENWEGTKSTDELVDEYQKLLT